MAFNLFFLRFCSDRYARAYFRAPGYAPVESLFPFKSDLLRLYTIDSNVPSSNRNKNAGPIPRRKKAYDSLC